jgi:hypothetical protein
MHSNYAIDSQSHIDWKWAKFVFMVGNAIYIIILTSTFLNCTGHFVKIFLFSKNFVHLASLLRLQLELCSENGAKAFSLMFL